jgi:adenosylcobinamide-GDP ribazoletransferase
VGGFLGAVQFLTRLPAPRATARLEDTVTWLPVVGVLLGAILAGIDWVLRAVQAPTLLTSTVSVVVLLGLSGALHADGLMDTFDAVFGHATPERRLEIMRDPRSGTFGVVALVCVVVLKIGALDALSTAARPLWLILAPGLGRWAIVLVARVFPYGRPSGLGAPLKAAATSRALAIASVLPIVGCALGGPVGILCGVAAAVTALALGYWFMRLLPGLTGDCYGAVCELVETVVWLTAALASVRATA